MNRLLDARVRDLLRPWLRPIVKPLLRPWLAAPAPRAPPSFGPQDIDELVRVYATHPGPVEGGPWDAYRHANMVLPDWYRPGLDPWGADYAAQQHRLWQLIAGSAEPYDAARDEREFGWDDVDAIRTPGFYMMRDAEAIVRASDHVLASGMLLRHCGLKAGDHALEYGPGFGQTALALARLGVQVDTVDISPTFASFVQQQGEHFGVPLAGFVGRFGDSPRPGQRYRLIWFYESFHHCVDFLSVVPKLGGLLADGGRIVLGGEPIPDQPCPGLPYPWGVRLHSEVAVAMRQKRWFELGFTEDFLRELFARSGFACRRVDCEPSPFGRLYIFERAPATRAATA